MRFIVMHKTNARWEAGEVPSPELIARVGALLGEMAKAGVLLGGEGLRASSQGVRLRRSGGVTTASPGPFEGRNELPAAFSVVRAGSLEEAVAWASRQSEALSDAEADVEIDVRPLTEPWDIGMAPRPENLMTRRYMALQKATAASEAGAPQSRQLARLLDETRRDGELLAAETLRPSRRGRRYKNTREGVTVTDGPFAESKELIAGFVMLSADSLEVADRWARRYIEVVEAEEVDLRELAT